MPPLDPKDLAKVQWDSAPSSSSAVVDSKPVIDVSQVKWDTPAPNPLNDVMTRINIPKLAATGPASIGEQTIAQPEVTKAAQTPGAINRAAITGGDVLNAEKNPQDVPSLRSQFEPALLDKARASLYLDKLPNQIQQPLREAISQTPALKSIYENLVSIPDLATDPVQLIATLGLIGAGESPLGKAIGESLGNFDPLGVKKSVNPVEASGKMQKLTSEVLNPPTNKTSPSYEYGQVNPVIETASKVMQPAKNFDEIINRFNKVAGKAAEEKKALVGANNRPLKSDYLKPLIQEIHKVSSPGSQETEANINALKDVFAKEIEFLKTKPDLIAADQRKTELQSITQKIQEAKNKGTYNEDTQGGRARGLDLVQKGLKNYIEQAHPMIKIHNRTYGDLQTAIEWAADQKAKGMNAPSPSWWEKLPFSKREIARTILDQQKNLLSKTKSIYELAKSIAKLDVPPEIKKEIQLQIAQGDLSPKPKELPAPKPLTWQEKLANEGNVKPIKETQALPHPTNLGEDWIQGKTPEPRVRGTELPAPPERKLLNSPKPMTWQEKLANENIKSENPQKSLPHPTNLGADFERVPEDEARRRLKEFMFKYYDARKDQVVLPEGFKVDAQPRVENLMKKMGFDWKTGKFRIKPLQSAFKKALERFSDKMKDQKGFTRIGGQNKAFWITDKGVHDITSDMGGGTDDHVGYLALATDKKFNPQEFGLQSGDIKALKKMYMTGTGSSEAGAASVKVINSGAIRVKIYGNELNVQAKELDSNVVDKVLNLIHSKGIKPTEVYYEDANQIHHKMTFEEFLRKK